MFSETMTKLTDSLTKLTDPRLNPWNTCALANRQHTEANRQRAVANRQRAPGKSGWRPGKSGGTHQWREMCIPGLAGVARQRPEPNDVLRASGTETVYLMEGFVEGV